MDSSIDLACLLSTGILSASFHMPVLLSNEHEVIVKTKKIEIKGLVFKLLINLSHLQTSYFL